ncbi:MAG: hypothetical protein CMH83_18435 [Nocardioides sp.]|nr:hypothetical protein [Nocardioides sp.]
MSRTLPLRPARSRRRTTSVPPLLAALLAPLLVRLLAVPSGAPTASAAEPAAPPTRSWMTMVPERGTWIGFQAATLVEDDDVRDVVVERGPLDEVEIRAGGSDIIVAAPYPDDLTVGTYTDARRFGDPDHPRLDVSSPGRGCNSSGGSFTVHEISEDLSRLWLTYDFRCGGGRLAVTGEVQVGLPADPAVGVAPTRVEWPAEPVGELGRIVPVTVTNPGSTPLTVLDVATDGDDFDVVQTSCDVVEPGEFCHAWVQFHPAAEGDPDLRSDTLTVRTDAGDRTVPVTGVVGERLPVPAGRARSGNGSGDGPVREQRGAGARTAVAPEAAEAPDEGLTGVVTAPTGPDNFVADGRPYRYGAAQLEQRHAADLHAQVRFDGSGGDGDFSATFFADEDHLLLPGTVFRPAGGVAEIDDAWFRIAQDHRGCGTNGNGAFVVDRADYSRYGYLQRLTVRFNWRCRDEADAMLGTIYWRHRAAARFTPTLTLDTSARRPLLGRRVALSGRLTIDTDWWPMAQELTLQAIRTREEGWFDVGTVQATRGGRYRVVRTPRVAAWYRVVLPGWSLATRATSPPVRVAPRPRPR